MTDPDVPHVFAHAEVATAGAGVTSDEEEEADG